MNRWAILFLLFIFSLGLSEKAVSQSSLDYYPHGVGDLWQYLDVGSGSTRAETITEDSIAANGFLFLQFNHSGNWDWYIDTAFQVFGAFDLLFFRLSAQDGEAWRLKPGHPTYGWLFQRDTSQTSSRLIFRYGPAHPDSGGNEYFLEERHLVKGIGLTWFWQEPDFVEVLTGAVVNGDTIGVITGISENIIAVPEKLFISPNYPNPFNPESRFKVVLPKSARVRLVLSNLLGQVVLHIYSGNLPAGEHSFAIRGSDLPSGVYVISLEAGRMRASRKIMVVK